MLRFWVKNGSHVQSLPANFMHNQQWNSSQYAIVNIEQPYLGYNTNELNKNTNFKSYTLEDLKQVYYAQCQHSLSAVSEHLRDLQEDLSSTLYVDCVSPILLKIFDSSHCQKMQRNDNESINIAQKPSVFNSILILSLTQGQTLPILLVHFNSFVIKYEGWCNYFEA